LPALRRSTAVFCACCCWLVKWCRAFIGVAEFWEVRPRIKGSYSHSLLSLSPPYLHTLLCQSPHTFIHYCTGRPIPSYIIVPVAPYLHTLLCQSPHTFIHYCTSRPIPSHIIVPVAPYLHALLCQSPLPSYITVPVAPYLHTLLC